MITILTSRRNTGLREECWSRLFVPHISRTILLFTTVLFSGIQSPGPSMPVLKPRPSF